MKITAINIGDGWVSADIETPDRGGIRPAISFDFEGDNYPEIAELEAHARAVLEPLIRDRIRSWLPEND
jgi:hypothetical protein